MIVWGGFGCTTQICQTTTYLNDGARYSPSANNWVTTSATNAPSARVSPTAVWTGSEMIVWGGFFRDGSNHYLNTGGEILRATIGADRANRRFTKDAWRRRQF